MENQRGDLAGRRRALRRHRGDLQRRRKTEVMIWAQPGAAAHEIHKFTVRSLDLAPEHDYNSIIKNCLRIPQAAFGRLLQRLGV